MNAWKTKPTAVYRDILSGIHSLELHGGTIWFRPPFGKLTLASMVQIFLVGKRVAWWTVDSRDTWKQPLTVDEVVDKLRCRGGGVLPVHDNSSNKDSLRSKKTLDLSHRVLEFARTEGFNVSTLKELFSPG